MRSRQKCKLPITITESSRDGFLIERPSSSSSAYSNNSNGSSSWQQHQGRQRLQRGAKDKAYATRLSANGDFDDEKHLKSPPDVRGNEGYNGSFGRGCAATAWVAVKDGTGSGIISRRCGNNKKRRTDISDHKDVCATNDETNTEHEAISSGNEAKSSKYCIDSNNIQREMQSLTENPTTQKQVASLSGEKLAKQSAPAFCVLSEMDNSKAASSDWSCSRCTCFNSNRRQKCQACGIPRYLILDFDGTLKMDKLCCKANGDVLSTSINNCEPSLNDITSTADSHSFSQEGDSQQLELFASIDAPVYTRSKRKERLSQTHSLTQPDESNDKGYEKNQSHHPPLHQLAGQPGGSEFQQWIRKRRSAKREKRQRIKSPKNCDANPPESSLGEMRCVAVRISALAGEGEASVKNHLEDQLAQRSLTAVLDAASLARIYEFPNFHFVLEDKSEPVDLDDKKNSQRDCKKCTAEDQFPHGEYQKCSPRDNCSVGNSPASIGSRQSPNELPHNLSCEGRQPYRTSSVIVRIKTLTGEADKFVENADADQPSRRPLAAIIPSAILAKIHGCSNFRSVSKEQVEPAKLDANIPSRLACKKNETEGQLPLGESSSSDCTVDDSAASIGSRQSPNELPHDPSCDASHSYRATTLEAVETRSIETVDSASQVMNSNLNTDGYSSNKFSQSYRGYTGKSLNEVSKVKANEGEMTKSSHSESLDMCSMSNHTNDSPQLDSDRSTSYRNQNFVVENCATELPSDKLRTANERGEKLDCILMLEAPPDEQQSSQCSVSIASPFIPMTQQMLGFDYFSQVSHVSYSINPGIYEFLLVHCLTNVPIGSKQIRLPLGPQKFLLTASQRLCIRWTNQLLESD